MHGAGNDYVYVNCFDEVCPSDPSGLARLICDRHVGIGADGLILICPSEHADARMRMFNVDGTEAEMCGNGIRCVAKYVYENGIAVRDRLLIETGAGCRELSPVVKNELVETVRVDMGEPTFDPDLIPTTLTGNPVVGKELTVGGRMFPVTCVSLGNPHCVVYVESITDDWVLEIGPKIEVDDHFPARVNVEFVEVISPSEVRQRTWERGSGETLACGSGASAVGVAGVLTGKTARKIQIHLLGGDLEVEWNDEDNHVYLTGSAVEVFHGEWPG